jgi:hypothetical protein
MLADTAQLAVVLTLKDQLTGGLTAAQAKLGGLEASATAVSAGGLTRLQKAGAGVGTALSHAGSQIGGLIKNIGMLAGVSGILGVGAALTSSITKVEEFGASLEKVQTLTGETAVASGALILQFQKFGLGTDKIATVVGFAEKTLGKMSETQGKAAKSAALLGLENTKLQIQAQGGKIASIDKAIAEQKATDALSAAAAGTTKLAAFDKQYGLSLVDTKGKVVNFSSVLTQLATFYDSNASASEKAYVASQVLGRGYTAMIPILNEGAAGLRKAAADAASLGLSSSNTVADLAKFHDQMHELGNQANLLQLSLGIALLPTLVDLSKAATQFVSDNRAGIVGGFKQAIDFAKELGGAISHTIIPAIQMIGGVWNSLPPLLKELLIGGFLANKAVKWTFGIDVAGLAGKALGGAIVGWVSNIFKGATTAAMSVQAGVVNVAGAGLPGGGPGGLVPAAETAGGAAVGGAASVAAGVAVAAGILASPFLLNNLAKTMNPTNDPNSAWGHTGGVNRAAYLPGGKGSVSSDLATGHGGSAGGGTWAYGLTQAQINATRAGERSTVTSHMLSAQISDALKGTLGASNLAQANALTSAFKESTGPSLHSMVSALNQDKAMQAKYLAQGDTKLAASIAGNIKYLAGRVDAVTQAINLKQFIATGILGSPSLTGAPHVSANVNAATGFTINVHPAGSSARQNTSAAVIQGRYGPTSAGGQATHPI